MNYKLFLVLFAAVMNTGCSLLGNIWSDPDPQAEDVSEIFPLELIELLGSTSTPCDDYATTNNVTTWTCAGYSQGYEDFIRSWELASIRHSLQDRFLLQPTSRWMYFRHGNATDFFAKSYRLQTTEVIIAHDPSQTGREIFVGVGPKAVQYMATADGLLENYDEVDEKSKRGQTNKAYSCADFENQAAAQQFFDNNGFSSRFDPYNLDSNNNGTACEIATADTHGNTTCPEGELWVKPYTISNGFTVKGHCGKQRIRIVANLEQE